MATTYAKILVPLDGSDFAARAIPHAEVLARGSGAALELLRVVQDIEESIGLAAEFDEGYLHRWQEELVAHAQEYLSILVSELEERGISATARVEIGSPADAILERAAADDIDLIVMTTHGRSGVARWVYGSIAGKILHHATCPLFLVRTGEE